MSSLIVFSIILIVIFYVYRKSTKLAASVSHFPGPTPYPLIGNAYIFFGKSAADLFDIGIKMVEKYGLVFKLMLGYEVLIHCADPDIVEALLVSEKELRKSKEYEITQDWIGTGLLTASPSKWYPRRKVMNNGFHFRCLQDFVKIFDKNSKILAEKLSEGPKSAKNIYPLVQLCALDNVCETVMGTKINAQLKSDKSLEYVNAVEEISRLITKRFFLLPLRNDSIFRLTPYYNQLQEILKVLHGFTENVIVSRRDELAKIISSGEEIKSSSLLDILLQSKIDEKPLTNADIREEVDTFTFAGHDTSSCGTSFCLYLLSQHPEVQQKVFEEIQNVLGDDLEKIATFNDLNNLNYLDLVIKEALRMFPPVPFIGRKLTRDILIHGKVFPKESTVVVPLLAIGYSNKFWEKPYEFIPERFGTEVPDFWKPSSFIPFGSGPRTCIGQKFALLEIKSIVSTIIRKFVLKPDPEFDLNFVPEIVLKPTNGLNLYLEPRSRD